MNINIELKNINYTNKRNIIDLSGLNLTNELLEPLLAVFPITETEKTIDITNNEGIVEMNITETMNKGYKFVYDEGQVIIDEPEDEENNNTEINNSENQNDDTNTENNDNQNTENNDSDSNNENTNESGE